MKKENRDFRTDEFFNTLNALPDKDSHLLAYFLQLTNEISELNKKLDIIIDRESKSVKVLVLR
jgi:hypothetical protein